MNDGKTRFSNRVDNYAKHRPGYPAEAVDYLFSEAGFASGSAVADMGAGTGIFTRILLERGAKVYAVEPNAEMLAQAENDLSGIAGFIPVHAPAEETGLDSGIVDFITAAQAFHWFDFDGAKREFARILKPGGKAVLIWNDRVTEGDSFGKEYDGLLQRYVYRYDTLVHKRFSIGDFAGLFADGVFRTAVFDNSQEFDFDGMRGRMLSSSYAPLEGETNYEEIMAGLREIFERNQSGGKVKLKYQTQLFWGEV
ncbi:MAG: class I SAM-dependent methyltransferase [Brevinematales bacterium]|nr:class I SAM-dependent methyltransferase [Brevinematales bacterium]